MLHALDRTDKSILRILQQDSSTPHKQIASKLNKSTSTISTRIKWLNENGYISANKATLNRKKLNLEVLGFIHLRLDNNSAPTIEAFKHSLNQIKGVYGCINMVGDYHFKVKVATRDTTSFSDIHKIIAGLAHVKESVNYIELEEVIPDKGYYF
ncbi:Lrp/AsnC family transcriptional regulator [Pedobacter sp. L105]|uniref:Lrp/AsnC family transcriptional regulator n=1 Tax=Pedobacter sp. L105 TaxID=1641871 RepID=UPI00131D39D2|nr:Lrp/AsnC family transcriptional regulator [Pedobacter sp. L105]